MINVPIWPVLNSSQISSMSNLSASCKKNPSKLNELCWWQSSTGGFSCNEGDVTPRLIIQTCQFSNLFKVPSVHLICKFQEDLIKTEQVILMTKSIRGFLAIKVMLLLRLVIQSDQFSKSSKISYMSTLSASSRKILLKLNELCWWQSQSDAFFNNQGDVTLNFMILSGQFSNSS